MEKLYVEGMEKDLFRVYFVYFRVLFIFLGVFVYASWRASFKSDGFRSFHFSFIELNHSIYRVLFIFVFIVLLLFLSSGLFSYIKAGLSSILFSSSKISTSFDVNLYYIALSYIFVAILEFVFIKFFILSKVNLSFRSFLKGLFLKVNRKDLFIVFQGFLLASFLVGCFSLLSLGIFSLYDYYFSDGIIDLGGDSLLERSRRGYSVFYLDSIFKSSASYFSFSRYIVLFVIIVLAPLVEEIVFRGTILPVLCKDTSFFRANVITSIIFAFVHFDFFVILSLFGMSFSLGLVYERSGSLFAPVILHSLWNTFTIISYLVLY